MAVAVQTVFKRYELKYLLTREQKARLLDAMQPHMRLDGYGRTSIRNIYYDTPDHLLIRRSIEKPVYKEKLRLRSYGRVDADGAVFVELKKKYESVVYKRRLSLPEHTAMHWLAGACARPVDTQIAREIEYFKEFYTCLRPAVFLSYEREAFYGIQDADFRVTLDDDILCRRDALSLRAELGGTPILPDDPVLLEIKCAGGMPLWMAHFLSREKIRKTSFSKYGTAYEKLIFPQVKHYGRCKECV